MTGIGMLRYPTQSFEPRPWWSSLSIRHPFFVGTIALVLDQNCQTPNRLFRLTNNLRHVATRGLFWRSLNFDHPQVPVPEPFRWAHPIFLCAALHHSKANDGWSIRLRQTGIVREARIVGWWGYNQWSIFSKGRLRAWSISHVHASLDKPHSRWVCMAV